MTPAPTGRRGWLRLLLAQAALSATAAGARDAGLDAGRDPKRDAQHDAIGPAAAPSDGAERLLDNQVLPGRRLQFPRDHGAHSGTAIEWWYLTGWLGPPGAADAPALAQPMYGFQITFFRVRSPLAAVPSSQAAGRFAPRQLLMAHVAVTDLAGRAHHHAQRLARWSGEETWPEAHARHADTGLALGPWRLRREADGPRSRYRCRVAAPEMGLALDLTLTSTQPLLLQGDQGFSQKGPARAQASHYYTQPQLAVRAELGLAGKRQVLAGSAWLDHEWSQSLLPSDAVGWDWMGINLHDGGALTAFVLRRADGSALWGGGSHRPKGGSVRAFEASEVRFSALAWWTSPATGARYPVHWQVDTPLGRFELRALLDAQEMDGRAGTGLVYWEGLSALHDGQGQRIGLGYLEMTGRAGKLRLGLSG